MPAARLQDIEKLGRLTRDLPGFLRRPLSSGQAAEVMRHRLATRGERFLGMARTAIFGHPRSPYLPLLQAAGCELGDLQALVADQGLEGALSRLVEAGVYLTFDEFKGQKAVVRGSQRLTFDEADFDNP